MKYYFLVKCIPVLFLTVYYGYICCYGCANALLTLTLTFVCFSMWSQFQRKKMTIKETVNRTLPCISENQLNLICAKQHILNALLN